MKILQSRSYARKVKKLNNKEKSVLDEQIRAILSDPDMGGQKKGDLRCVFVHKFKIKTKQYLLAYRIVDENLQLIMLGPHENYYRDLKKSVKSM